MRKGPQMLDNDLIEKMHASHQPDKLETLLLDENPQVPIKTHDANIVIDWDMKTLNEDKNRQKGLHQCLTGYPK